MSARRQPAVSEGRAPAPGVRSPDGQAPSGESASDESADGGLRQELLTLNFGPESWKYLAVEALLIVVMTYFYTSVVFNPVDQADNLRKYSGYIPGIRPGPPTAAYFDRVLNRLTFPGALFLAAVSVAPSIFIAHFHFSQATSRALGGTSVLIVVGVALQTMRQMESQMVMRHYEGFLR